MPDVNPPEQKEVLQKILEVLEDIRAEVQWLRKKMEQREQAGSEFVAFRSEGTAR